MKHTGMGPEHPQCHSVQKIMTALFFLSWIADTWLSNTSGYSTVINVMPRTAAYILAAVSVLVGLYLVTKSHKAIFASGKRGVIATDVYAWIRHPMYLGVLLFFLGFIIVSTSLLSLAIWLVFFLAYDRMASYEENMLLKKFGNNYRLYQQRVGKWLPRI